MGCPESKGCESADAGCTAHSRGAPRPLSFRRGYRFPASSSGSHIKRAIKSSIRTLVERDQCLKGFCCYFIRIAIPSDIMLAS